LCHRFEACLIKYGFAERVPEYSYELDGPNGKKIKITTTFRLLPEMAKRILNYDETPIFSNKTCTRRQKNLKSDRIKAGAASKTKEGQSHGTLNAGTSMPDTCDGGRAVSMPNQVRRAVTQAAGAVERCVCFRWLLQLVLASLILSASTRRRLTSLLPQVIFSTTSKNPEKLKPTAAERAAYPKGTVFGFSSTGSTSARTFEQLIHMLKAYYGDVANQDGRRVVLKADSGPALPKDPEVLEQLRDEGFIIFPGLPNGTHVNQEMDQARSAAGAAAVVAVVVAAAAAAAAAAAGRACFSSLTLLCLPFLPVGVRQIEGTLVRRASQRERAPGRVQRARAGALGRGSRVG